MVDDDIQRWTAKRRTALVASIIKGEISVQEAARRHGLAGGAIEKRIERAVCTGMLRPSLGLQPVRGSGGDEATSVAPRRHHAARCVPKSLRTGTSAAHRTDSLEGGLVKVGAPAEVAQPNERVRVDDR